MNHELNIASERFGHLSVLSLTCITIGLICISCGGGGGSGSTENTPQFTRATVGTVILPTSVPAGSFLVGSPTGHLLVAVSGLQATPQGSSTTYTLPTGGTPVALEGASGSMALLSTTQDGSGVTHLWVSQTASAPSELGTGLLALSANGVSAIVTNSVEPQLYQFNDKVHQVLSASPFRDSSFSFGNFGLMASLPISISDLGAVFATDGASKPATYSVGAFVEGNFTGATTITSADSHGLTPNLAGTVGQKATIYSQLSVYSNWTPNPLKDLYGGTSDVEAGVANVFLGRASRAGSNRWIVWEAFGVTTSYAFDITDKLTQAGVAISSVAGGGELLTQQGFTASTLNAEFVYKDASGRLGTFRVTIS